MRHRRSRIIDEFSLRVFPCVREFVPLRFSQRLNIEFLDPSLAFQQETLSLRRVPFGARHTPVFRTELRAQLLRAMVTGVEPDAGRHGDDHGDRKENNNSDCDSTHTTSQKMLSEE